ncbi:RHS repeat-associated core domain-containing protein [Streptomyces sp. NPDC059985]|uniref:RHS repeat domain-containing protein n=1 Tax=Streptomyces sp. NPDC059985 TaxID=3347025 RepID=UPI0036D0555B
MFRSFRNGSIVRRLSLGVSISLLVSLLPALTWQVAYADTPPGVSNTLALGEGVGGVINERTGAFEATLPLLNVQSRGDAGAHLTLSYSQALAKSKLKRFDDLGEGWSFGMNFFDTSSDRLYMRDGSSYKRSQTELSGLQRYALRDLLFKKQSGTRPARAGVEAQHYAWELHHTTDKRVEYFNSVGDLVAQKDRFGNEITYIWEAGDSHVLREVVDSYGLKTSISRPTSQLLKISSSVPARMSGSAPSISLHFSSGELRSMTNPAGQVTQFEYSKSYPSFGYLNKVTGPSGITATVRYLEPFAGIVAVDDVTVSASTPQGKKTYETRKFTMDPRGQGGNTFAGRDVAGGSEGLFDSSDLDFKYETQISDGHTAVRSTYNKLHLLKNRELRRLDNQAIFYNQEFTYPGEDTYGRPPIDPMKIPNYSRPRSSVTNYLGQAGAKRTVKETAAFDNFGRKVESVDFLGVKTSIKYDSNSGEHGQIIETTVTGPDGQEKEIVKNIPSKDRKSIESTQTLVANEAGELKAQTSTSFEVNAFGETVKRTVSWADGVQPGGEGPAVHVTEASRDVNLADRTLTDKTTIAPGTDAATTEVTVTDLVTGNRVERRDGADRATTFSYDAAGREIKRVEPGGFTTTTSYTSTSKTIQYPNGRRITENRDPLGRPTVTTDNVKKGDKSDELADDAARTLSTYKYDSALITRHLDGANRETVEHRDSLGRVLKTQLPNGVTEHVEYDTLARKKTIRTVPAGKDIREAVSTRVEKQDEKQRLVEASTSYAPDGSASVSSNRVFDDRGQIAEVTAEGVTSKTRFGDGGVAEGALLTPTEALPGKNEEGISVRNMPSLTGTPFGKEFSQGEAKISGTRKAFDAAGRVSSVTDQNDRRTSYTYTKDGQVELESLTAKDGSLITSTKREFYDEGRVKSETVTKPGKASITRVFEYELAYGKMSAIYDAKDPKGTRIEYTYDFTGNCTSVTYPDGTTLQHRYDETGQLEWSKDGTDAFTEYRYNKFGAPEIVTQRRGEDTLASVSYTYDELGRTKGIARDDGSHTAFDYWNNNQIKLEKTTKGEELISESKYTYTPKGNVQARIDVRGVVGGPPTLTHSSYVYDSFDRLESSELRRDSTEGELLKRVDYSLSPVGDVTATRTRYGSGPVEEVEYKLDAVGQRIAIIDNGENKEQKYDDAGNLEIDHRGMQYAYNAHNQPTAVEAKDGARTEYTYWADGTRADTTHSDTTGLIGVTRFYYNPDGLLANDIRTESHAQGAQSRIISSHLFGLTREHRSITTEGNGDSLQSGGYLLYDRHGSVVTTISKTGQSDFNYYDDYGRSTDSSGVALPSQRAPKVNPFGFSGQYTNIESGTQYLSSRTYDPSQLSFTTRDTASQVKRYQAFDANPINKVDPRGTTASSDASLSYGMLALTILLAIVFTVITIKAAIATGGAALAVIIPAVVAAVTTVVGGAADIASSAIDTYLVETEGENSDSEAKRSGLATASQALMWIGIGLGLPDAGTSVKGTWNTFRQGKAAGKGVGTVSGPAPTAANGKIAQPVDIAAAGNSKLDAGKNPPAPGAHDPAAGAVPGGNPSSPSPLTAAPTAGAAVNPGVPNLAPALAPNNAAAAAPHGAEAASTKEKVGSVAGSSFAVGLSVGMPAWMIYGEVVAATPSDLSAAPESPLTTYMYGE